MAGESTRITAGGLKKQDCFPDRRIEDEAVERAMVGIFEPNVYQGRFCYPQEEYVVKPAVIGKRGAVLEPEVRAWCDVPGAPPLCVWKKSDMLLSKLLEGLPPGKIQASGRGRTVGD
jgi:hypothetical protein